jgi:hypothetical protein
MSYGEHGLTHPVRKKLHGLRGEGFIVFGPECGGGGAIEN